MKEELLEQCDCMHEHKELREQILRDMPDEEQLGELAAFFKVFGDVTRVRILYTLLKSEMCVCDLSETLKMTVSAVSHQLRILRQAHLVRYRRVGKTVFYALADDQVKTLLSQGLDHVRE